MTDPTTRIDLERERQKLAAEALRQPVEPLVPGEVPRHPRVWDAPGDHNRQPTLKETEAIAAAAEERAALGGNSPFETVSHTKPEVKPLSPEAAALLRLARAYCAATGIGLRGLEKRSGRDALFRRLAAGRGCRPENANAAFEWLAANWPAGTPWPDGAARPQVVEAGEPVVGERLTPVLFEEDREAEVARIRAAQALLARADPMLLAEERYRAAVRGVPLYDTLAPPAGPSLGGLTVAQMEEAARKQASAEQQFQNEEAARKRWVASQEETIRSLQAGQSPETQALIRAQFNAQKGGG